MPPELAVPPERPPAGHAPCSRKPGSSTPDEADHPGTAMAARLPDQFHQRGPLDTYVGGWMEQEAAKVPEPD
jgi:hypothetical protein